MAPTEYWEHEVCIEVARQYTQSIKRPWHISDIKIVCFVFASVIYTRECCYSYLQVFLFAHASRGIAKPGPGLPGPRLIQYGRYEQ